MSAEANQMSMGYLPPQRTFTTTYAVHTTGDRLFSPKLASTTTSMTNQLAQCQALIGKGKDGATASSEEVLPDKENLQNLLEGIILSARFIL